MRVRVGDAWFSIAVAKASTPGGDLAFIVDRDTGMLLDRASASKDTLTEIRGTEATLKSGVASCIQSKFKNCYIGPCQVTEKQGSVEKFLGEGYSQEVGEDVIWEDTIG